MSGTHLACASAASNTFVEASAASTTLAFFIEQGDDKAFAEIANGDTAVVHLDSIGGNLLASLRIGGIIRSKRYGTVVPANGVPGSHLSWWRPDCVAGVGGLEVRRETGKE